jgi:hypothetical protein
LAEKRIVRLEECRTVNDFKLLQISWALDLGFNTSYRLLLERGYIPRLSASLLGDRGEVDRSVLEIMMEVERRAKAHGESAATG